MKVLQVLILSSAKNSASALFILYYNPLCVSLPHQVVRSFRGRVGLKDI